MKKTMKVINIILIAIMILMTTINVVSASTEGIVQPGSITGTTVEGTTGIQNIGNQIVTIVSSIGSVVSVVVLVVLGLKYMMGSAEEKAEYKKTLLPYVIGASLVFAASAIAAVIFGFANNISANI